MSQSSHPEAPKDKIGIVLPEAQIEGPQPDLTDRAKEIHKMVEAADPGMKKPETNEILTVEALVVGDCAEGLENKEGLYVRLSAADLQKLGIESGRAVTVRKDGIDQLPSLVLPPKNTDTEGECRAIHAAVGDKLTFSPLVVGEMPPTAFPVKVVEEGSPDFARSRPRLEKKGIKTWFAVPPVIARQLNFGFQKKHPGEVGWYAGQQQQVVIEGQTVDTYLDSQKSEIRIPVEMLPALGLSAEQLSSGTLYATIRKGQLHLQTTPFETKKEEK